MKRDRLDHATVVTPSGDTTHILIPKADYDRLNRSEDQGVERALAILDNPRTKWHNADDVLRDLISNGIGAARKSRGLSQAKLAELLGVAQPQVSRYERNPDSMTLRILKKIAATLANTEPAADSQAESAARPKPVRKKVG